jgi:hypothetical protein
MPRKPKVKPEPLDPGIESFVRLAGAADDEFADDDNSPEAQIRRGNDLFRNLQFEQMQRLRERFRFQR